MHLPQKKPKHRTAESYTRHTESWITLGVLPQPLSEEWVLLVPPSASRTQPYGLGPKSKLQDQDQNSKIQNSKSKIQDPESKIEDQKKIHNPKDPKSKSQNSKSPQDPKI